jgi:SAM-dependent methyltransferase
MHEHQHDDRDWDAFYAGDGDDAPHWSGQPNGSLVVEVSGLRPGTALDVGCGEGADAIWLARQGWRVTAADPSRVALDRAEAAARAVGVEVAWVHAGLLEMPGGTGTYDLVSAQYPVLRRTDDDEAITTLLGAVAPGGTLLVVHHDLDPAHADEDASDTADHVMPADVEAHLDDGWQVELHEARPRPGPVPPEARHVRDLVLRARRLPVTRGRSGRGS